MRFELMKRTLCSVVAIPVTPFTKDGGLDLSAHARLVGRLVDGGISVITPNGTTSEFHALSPNECRKLVEVTVDIAGSRALVVPGVGFDVSTAVDMGRHAERSGAKAVMVHQPTHPHKSSAGWVAYHRAIAEALPDLGFILYIRDASVTAEAILQLVRVCSNVIGIKYAVPDPVQFGTMVRETEPDCVTWLCGLAELWAPFFWVAGARGFTSGLANVDVRRPLKMLRSLETGDYEAAMTIWAQVKPFEDLRARHNNANAISVLKEALSLLGFCERTVRPPINELPQSERDEVQAILAAWETSAALAD